MEAPMAYFGFGALMNRVSLRLRGVVPSESRPALLRRFRLVFGGRHGMATVVPDEASFVQGVLHMVTPAQKAQLDASEASYERRLLEVEVGDEKKDGGLRQGALHGERHAPKDLGGL
ncbi:unnamed protein product [Effrenium voratum]|nr:unnamed protein product [Effrenium voratum]